MNRRRHPAGSELFFPGTAEWKTESLLTQHFQRVATPPSHASCMVCGHLNSLGIKSHACTEESVSAHFEPDCTCQGYMGIMHGGMISTLLDAAMTHCLFQQGVEAVTASLDIRFIEPVPCNDSLRIDARLISQRHHIYYLDAELSVAGRALARASARFIPRTRATKSPSPR